jgi:uncharacterized LabA/DUF88 family protein
MATGVAVLVDGDYFVRLFRRKVNPTKSMSGTELAKLMWRYWILHADPLHDEQIYRIFFYDCPPLEDRFVHPVTDQNIDFSKTPQAIFRKELHQALVKQPYVARRMGFLSKNDRQWKIADDRMHKSLLAGRIQANQIPAEKIVLHAPQKGVDMKLGLDIATLTLKKQVNKIVLISGDSDFVPAAKLARAEGVHFVLDAMQASINADLSEHIDGLSSHLGKFASQIAKEHKSRTYPDMKGVM